MYRENGEDMDRNPFGTNDETGGSTMYGAPDGYDLGLGDAGSATAKKRRRLVPVWLLILCIIVASVVGAFAGVFAVNMMSASGVSFSTVNVTTSDESGIGSSAAGNIVGTTTGAPEGSALETSMESVVCISTTSIQQSSMGLTESTSSGSGVVLTSDGYIVTCAHVVEGAESVTVQDSNNNQYSAQVIGMSESTDIALLKIDASGLTPATINVNTGSVGDTVYVIGNPLGNFVLSVTKGIISGLDRQVTVNGVTMNLTQVDASVNPGNSGGGLFNEEGELIGIVNAKATDVSVEGMGFAIPANQVVTALQDIADQAGISLNI